MAIIFKEEKKWLKILIALIAIVVIIGAGIPLFAYEKIGENTYIFDAKIHIGEFIRAIGYDEDSFSDVEGHAETLAGLMMELKRDLPRRGDELEAHGVKFFIATMDGRRVDKIKVDIHG